MTLAELMQDLHALNSELEQYENKYGLLSAYFYRLYEMGVLEENDDYLKWAGLYRIKQNREMKYKEFLPDVLSSLETKSDVEIELLMD